MLVVFHVEVALFSQGLLRCPQPSFLLTLFFPQTERGKLLIEEKGHKPAQKEEKTILCCRKGRIEEGCGDTKLAVYGGL